MEPENIDFVPGVISLSPPSPLDWCLIVFDDGILFTEAGRIPTRQQVERLLPAGCMMRYLGAFREHQCYYCGVSTSTQCEGDVKKLDLRTILSGQETSVFHLCCRAIHLLAWQKKHLYCGVCAEPLVDKTDELARQCPACGSTVYPRISPAVIVAVIRDNAILLARNKRSKLTFHSVLAGFVEPGETLEECVRREVFEETGIAIKNIRYFASQPWPFPDSLMVAFVADHASGEICVNENELETAGWFTADNLPEIPSAPSISRKLIEWFLSSRKTFDH